MIDGVYSKRQKFLVNLGLLSELVFKQKEIKDEFCSCLSKKHTPQSDSWVTCVLLSPAAHHTIILVDICRMLLLFNHIYQDFIFLTWGTLSSWNLEYNLCFNF